MIISVIPWQLCVVLLQQEQQQVLLRLNLLHLPHLREREGVVLEVEGHLHQKVGVLVVVGVLLLQREGGRAEEVEQEELVGLQGQGEGQEEPLL